METYRMSEAIRSRIPDDFYYMMVDELAKIFPHSRFCDDSDFIVSTAGWYQALENTCQKLGMEWFCDFYNKLEWYKSDMVDAEIETEIINKLRKKSRGTINMDERAVDIVNEYVVKHLDASDGFPDYEIYIVWKCKTLQNWKYLVSTTLPDGMYYELTYNGDKDEWYLGAYKKFENRVIKD